MTIHMPVVLNLRSCVLVMIIFPQPVMSCFLPWDWLIFLVQSVSNPFLPEYGPGVFYDTRILGNPADMDEVSRIAEKHDLLVLEDCCQGLGARYKGRPAGSLGDIGAFSFNINKVFATFLTNGAYLKQAITIYDLN